MANTIYKVTINQYAAPGENQGGFIDAKSVIKYGLIEGLTYDQCKDKKRANMRWYAIMEALSLEANPFFNNITATGATVALPATSFYFEVTYATAGQPTITRDGSVFTGAEAIKQMIAEALIVSFNPRCETFDPTMTDEINSPYHFQGVIASHLAVGPRWEILSVGALAASVDEAKANITVTV
jgi:hypothetical protein